MAAVSRSDRPRARRSRGTRARLGMERAMGVHLQGEIAGRLVKLGQLRRCRGSDRRSAARRAGGHSRGRATRRRAAMAARHGGTQPRSCRTALNRADADEAGSGSRRPAACGAGRARVVGRRSAAAWTIMEEALARVREAEYVWYSAPLYALGAWALADRALGARAAGDDPGPRGALRRGRATRAARRAAARRGVPEPAAYRAQVTAELPGSRTRRSPPNGRRARSMGRVSGSRSTLRSAAGARQRRSCSPTPTGHAPPNCWVRRRGERTRSAPARWQPRSRRWRGVRGSHRRATAASFRPTSHRASSTSCA